MRVAVVDYGSGNLHSVVRALRFVGATDVLVTGDPEVVLGAQRVVFPGQGAMGSCVSALRQQGLGEAIVEAATKIPTLGICMGLQVLFDLSEEDRTAPGLALFPGQVRRFTAAAGQQMKIPHMGWNQVRRAAGHPLWAGIDPGAWFYFVHSYFVAPQHSDIVAGTTEYGGVEFVSAVARDRLFAVQFHPEKSHNDGLRLLRNFLDWDGEG